MILPTAALGSDSSTTMKLLITEKFSLLPRARRAIEIEPILHKAPGSENPACIPKKYN